MIAYPNAKINLGLQILSRRNDGFHTISSCFYPIPIGDILEIMPSKETSFKSTGLPIPGEGNLCLQAYYQLKESYSLPPVSMHLHKVIPIGAGLGGGSSDASFTLKMLNNLFDLDLSQKELETRAAKLGSDCPFFINNEPVIAEGTGDIFTATDRILQGYYLVLIYPKIHVSTADAYREVTPNSDQIPITKILSLPISDWQKQLTNDFEQSVFREYEEIKGIKDELIKAGALYASMTGSGSAVYALYENKPKLPASLSQWIAWQGAL